MCVFVCVCVCEKVWVCARRRFILHLVILQLLVWLVPVVVVVVVVIFITKKLSARLLFDQIADLMNE